MPKKYNPKQVGLTKASISKLPCLRIAGRKLAVGWSGICHGLVVNLLLFSRGFDADWSLFCKNSLMPRRSRASVWIFALTAPHFGALCAMILHRFGHERSNATPPREALIAAPRRSEALSRRNETASNCLSRFRSVLDYAERATQSNGDSRGTFRL